MINQSSLFNLSWPRYLNLLFLILSAGFLASGIVTLIAANLDYFSDLAKIYGLQLILVASVLLGSYFFLRESQKVAKEKLKLLSATFFFLTAVLIGAVFVLVGQTYQTGANAWELFALWSLCQLPLLLLLPNIASALLLIATTNLTLYLYYDAWFDHGVVNYVVLLNFIFLVLSEIFIRQLHDQNWRILPKILTFLVLSHLFGVRVITDNLPNDIYSGVYFFLVFLQVVIPSGIVIYVYKKYRFDFVNLITATICSIVAFGIFLFSNVNSGDFAVLAGLLLFIITIFAIMLLHGWYKQHYPHLKNISWALSILLIFAIFIGIVTALIWLFLTLNVSEPKTGLLILSVIVLFIALGLHFGNPHAESHMSIIIGIFFFMGYNLLAGYFLADVFDSYGEGALACDVPLLFTAIISMLYFLRKENWLRTLSLVIVLGVWHIYLTDCSTGDLSHANRIEYSYVPLYFVTMLGCVIAFFVQNIYGENSKVRVRITPVAWAFLLFSIGGWAFSTDNFLSLFVVYVPGTVDALPEIDTFSGFFTMITAGFYSRAVLGLGWTIPFLVCFTPLVTYFAISRFFSLKTDEKMCIAAILALFTFLFVGQPSVLFFVTLLLIAYFVQSRTLFFIGVLSLVGNLAIYYYLLFIPLLYKAFLLLFFALLFSAVAIYLHTKHQPQTQSAVSFSSVSKVKPMVALCTVLLILIPLNYKVWQFENVLMTGKPVVLKIAPVDPRSIIQGDYMSLSYAILTDIRAQLNTSVNDQEAAISGRKTRSKRVYVLVHQDEQGVATLCRVENRIPTDFYDCVPDMYLPVNNVGWFPQLPSQEYFFAEGKGQHYAQAEYAEYRFKDGILLLARLLDKDLKGL
ncbi:beta-carotene 15,15'-monooxygenase [Aggregatibacter actinomycetemcomitans]|uniref:GDYXXLXY domain-containing protein n=1 Tax=Aggregatibacter actinomycetemcomitans TaxID=714 RepID=UPI000BA19C87|nr:GDYXXLXY domain-containing protein [Aggregatibacter actinomycetemcomitans]OZV17029.1 beta-carotene 15,15'-monooxygenase [Aggregatibacter actinomycetemcomitans]